MLKKNYIKFQVHNNRVLSLVALDFCTGSNEDTFYIKGVALNEIYNFIVLSFYI
jgi:hypothetical protein